MHTLPYLIGIFHAIVARGNPAASGDRLGLIVRATHDKLYAERSVLIQRRFPACDAMLLVKPVTEVEQLAAFAAEGEVGQVGDAVILQAFATMTAFYGWHEIFGNQEYDIASQKLQIENWKCRPDAILFGTGIAIWRKRQ